jgi:hypothetical protein
MVLQVANLINEQRRLQLVRFWFYLKGNLSTQGHEDESIAQLSTTP